MSEEQPELPKWEGVCQPTARMDAIDAEEIAAASKDDNEFESLDSVLAEIEAERVLTDQQGQNPEKQSARDKVNPSSNETKSRQGEQHGSDNK